MITVNGEARELPAGTRVAEVVVELVGPDAGRGIAVAVNGEVVPRTSWPETALASGDRVEVLIASQGG